MLSAVEKDHSPQLKLHRPFKKFKKVPPCRTKSGKNGGSRIDMVQSGGKICKNLRKRSFQFNCNREKTTPKQEGVNSGQWVEKRNQA